MTTDLRNTAEIPIHAWSRTDGAFGLTINTETFTLDLEDAVALHDKLCEALAVRRKVLERNEVWRK